MQCNGEECKDFHACRYLQSRFKVLYCVEHTKEVNRVHQLELKAREELLKGMGK